MTATIILLVEDHAANRHALRRRLERQGFQVIEAEDGQRAVEEFEQSAVDIVLMDLSMPRMSGVEALQAIRESERGRNTPIVALTAHAMDSTRKSCEDVGFSAFVTKPVDFPVLLSTIRSLCAGAVAL